MDTHSAFEDTILSLSLGAKVRRQGCISPLTPLLNLFFFLGGVVSLVPFLGGEAKGCVSRLACCRLEGGFNFWKRDSDLDLVASPGNSAWRR